MKFFKWGLMLMFLTLALFSCKDDESVLGENFLDGKLNLKFDTIVNVSTLSTAYEDTSSVLSGASISLIGDYHDDIFGDHKAITAFNFIPQSNSADTGNFTAISLKMHMEYRGSFYGFDTINETKFSIYRAIDSLGPIDGSPLSTIDLSQYYDPIPLAEATYILDSATRSGENFLDFELPVELGSELLDNWDKIESDSLFKTFFYGFVIKAERQSESGGNIVAFNFADTDTKMQLEFYDQDAPEDTLTFNFYISDSDNNLPTEHFNFFEHNYATGEISQYMNSTDVPDFNANDEYVFLQAMRGINMKLTVDMSGADFLNEDGQDIVINRAILKLYTTKRELPDNDTLKYAPPGSITITELDEDGSSIPIVDYYLPSYDLSAPQGINDSVYGIVLSGLTHQKIGEGETEYTLWVRSSQPSVSANRAVIFGGGYPVDSLRPKVYITYTKRTNN